MVVSSQRSFHWGFTKSLKMDKCLRLGGEQLRLSCCARILLKSLAKSHGDGGLEVMVES